MTKYIKVLRIFLAVFFTGMTAAVLVIAAAYLYLAPGLPEIETLKDVKLTLPLRVYARDGGLIAEFGKERRTPVTYSNVPDLMIKAFLAAEDDRFFEHPGVDYQGLLRAALHLIKTGEKGQGGSTITMQVARNFFLSREKTFLRKFNEIFLSLKIEREISKEEILELYLNVIYLGHRSYGVQAASQVYYGRNVHELSLAEIAMIAGLPKAPSRYNPIVNPQRALLRRNYVLGRMKELNYITDHQYQQALETSVVASIHGLKLQVEAPYIAEMVRSKMQSSYGNEIYTRGFRVYTTIDSQSQKAANDALRKSLLSYDKRHGFRGVERNFVDVLEFGYDQWDMALRDIPSVGGLQPGIVEVVKEKYAYVYMGKGKNVKLNLDEIEWARAFVDENTRGPAIKMVSDILKPGDLIRLQKVDDKKWMLSQIPKVAGALVSLSSRDGGIISLAGGFDYFYSKFNRVVQAKRQPGSSFKPFIYTAALAKGFTPASVVNDAPVVFNDPALEDTWRPENYSGKFYGPTRLREALVHSRNLVSIRILRDMGIGYTARFLKKFGITRDMIQRDLSLALGSGSITPLELARSYAVIANGGYQVEPYFIARIEDDDGALIFEAKPAIACLECEEQIEKDKQDKKVEIPEQDKLETEEPESPNLAKRSLSQQNAYLIHSMMRDVVRRGTGRGAMKLGRYDLAGKTGTTNDQRDAWFSGFNSDVVTTAWVGFDKVQPLGNKETGGRAALPMWVDFMREALKGRPEKPLKQPEGLVTVRIDPVAGCLAIAKTKNAIFETFEVGKEPMRCEDRGASGSNINQRGQTPAGGGHPDIIF